MKRNNGPRYWSIDLKKPIPEVRKLDERDRAYIERAPSASEKFSRLLEACLRDGYISPAEAQLLVHEHNRMQEESRAALMQKLIEYGRPEANDRMDRTSMSIPRQSEPDISYAYQVKPVEVDASRWNKIIWFAIVIPAVVVCALALLGVI